MWFFMYTERLPQIPRPSHIPNCWIYSLSIQNEKCGILHIPTIRQFFTMKSKRNINQWCWAFHTVREQNPLVEANSGIGKNKDHIQENKTVDCWTERIQCWVLLDWMCKQENTRAPVALILKHLRQSANLSNWFTSGMEKLDIQEQ